MTGYYVRIERGGKFEPVEIDKMTDQEMNDFFAGHKDAGKWAISLAKWIRDNVGESP